MENKLYAEWHHLELRPSANFGHTDQELEAVVEILGYSWSDFENKSSSEKFQYRFTLTYRRLIDLEFEAYDINTNQYGTTEYQNKLLRLVIHGDAFNELKLNTGHILTQLEQQGFVCVEAHSRILIPKNFLTWEMIDKYFQAKAYACNCSRATPLHDPSNDHASTWQAGKRPSGRSMKSQGKRLTFYEAHKIHPELEYGTSTMELQLFGYTANEFVFGNASRDVDLTVKTIGVTRSYLEFKTLKGDGNVSRRPTANFWLRVVGNTPAIHLPRLQNTETRLDNQIKKFKTMLYSAHQRLGDDPFLEAISQYLKKELPYYIPDTNTTV